MAKKTGLFVILSIVIVAVLVSSVVLNDFSVSTSPEDFVPDGTTTSSTLQVVFFDVGQADCILLQTDSHNMLIDAGNLGQDKLVLNYLAEYGVTDLDYLVATHPHADHIGSMPSVVRAMNSVGTVIMPDKTHTTKNYENLINAIDEKGVPVTIPKAGDVFEMGNAVITVIAPNSAVYNDLNDYSVVLRVDFGNTVFLFTGDADTKSENEQLANGLSLKADVLKVGHHGSRTSSIQKYLDAVAPSYAVIFCGADNTYGHPHKESWTRLIGTGATIYRTDENGTIVFVTDGETISVSVENGVGSTPAETVSLSYIGNNNRQIFHLSTCSSLPQEQNKVYFNSRQEAIDAGYTSCNTCKP
ncbi:MAG: MBL fold metallo-hydrolase [Nitrososphaerota archaeon]|jgi:competence protein ComEC|nr:MBL fold metallo-hydrolase [Nitrososphaerota archaeon]